jgi:hypothetical protein
MSEGFWAVSEESVIPRGPAVILKEQAATLRAATKGELTGQVIPWPAGQPGDMGMKLMIVAPSLNSYAYEVLLVRYPLLTMWPAQIDSNVTSETLEVENEEQFNEALRKILGSAEIQRIIGALRAQVRQTP